MEQGKSLTSGKRVTGKTGSQVRILFSPLKNYGYGGFSARLAFYPNFVTLRHFASKYS